MADILCICFACCMLLSTSLNVALCSPRASSSLQVLNKYTKRSNKEPSTAEAQLMFALRFRSIPNGLFLTATVAFASVSVLKRLQINSQVTPSSFQFCVCSEASQPEYGSESNLSTCLYCAVLLLTIYETTQDHVLYLSLGVTCAMSCFCLETNCQTKNSSHGWNSSPPTFCLSNCSDSPVIQGAPQHLLFFHAACWGLSSIYHLPYVSSSRPPSSSSNFVVEPNSFLVHQWR